MQSSPPRSGTFAALGHRNFRLMWVSLLVSNSGTWLQGVAQDYLVYQMTGRALDLGIVNVARAIALISLSFLGGTIADRLDRRKLLIATQILFAASATLLGLLVQFGLVRVWHVAALAFVNAALLALDQPARSSLLPHLVPREHLLNAIALNSITFTGAAAVGPALAGPIVNTFGTVWGFYLNAFSYLAVVWAVWAMRLPAAPSRRQTEPIGTAVASGFRYIASSPAILLLVSLLTIFSFFTTPYQALLPIFANRVFGGGVQELGFLRTGIGVGALTGGLLLASLSSSVRQRGWLVIGGGLSFSAAIASFSNVRWLPGAFVLLVAGSLSATIFQSSVQTLMQQLTDDKMRGRVMSLFAISVMGMWPLGALPLSWAADRFGATAAATGGALISAAYAMGVAVFARQRLSNL